MNHREAEVEKGQDHYESKDNVHGNQTSVGADTVVGAAGSGEMQRGLKSRHIQFL
jgi:amino acid permease